MGFCFCLSYVTSQSAIQSYLLICFLPIYQSSVFFVEYQSQADSFLLAGSISVSVVAGCNLLHSRLSSSIVRHLQLHDIDDFWRLYGEVDTSTSYLLFFFNVKTADVEEVLDDESEVLFKDKLFFLLSTVRSAGDELLQAGYALL